MRSVYLHSSGLDALRRCTDVQACTCTSTSLYEALVQACTSSSSHVRSIESNSLLQAYRQTLQGVGAIDSSFHILQPSASAPRADLYASSHALLGATLAGARRCVRAFLRTLRDCNCGLFCRLGCAAVPPPASRGVQLLRLFQSCCSRLAPSARPIGLGNVFDSP